MFKKQRVLNIIVLLAMVTALFVGGGSQVKAQTPTTPSSPDNISGNPLPQKPMTNAQRAAAAQRASKARAATAAALGPNAVTLLPTPGGAPDYFGIFPNWANSPFPASISNLGDGTGALMTVTVDPTGAVSAVTVLSGGTGYTAAATNSTSLTVVGGGGTGAVLTPTIDPVTGAILSVAVTTPGTGYNSVPGIRKFVDTLPGLTAAGANDLGNYIPLGVPDQKLYAGSDYYEIAVVQYKQQFSADLPPSNVRGYVQVWSQQLVNDVAPTVIGKVQLFYPSGSPILDASNNPVYALDKPSYLGPTLVAQANVPVRVKFTNYLPTGTGGNLFIPVDTSDMGAGLGPDGINSYTQNRATLHLHGGLTPWISDGTPHQWITPAGESTVYPKGVSVQNVPDMPDPGPGSSTFFYTNQQSARLMFYHDHAYGITRLNVYAGEAAGYLLQDTVEKQLQAAGIIPTDANQIPLVIQDKSFVPSPTQLLAEDPTWDTAAYGGYGNLWFPHVYMTNQNPADISGANPMGRWDYALWFWPPVNCTSLPAGHCLITNIFAVNGGAEPAQVPGIPQPSLTPEAFMDTMTVNGTAYPVLTVQPQPYRFRILNAGNDRMLNLQLYNAASNNPMWNLDGVGGKPGTLADANAGEVPMVPAVATPGYPATWPTDGRAGGVPDPAAAGPSWVQIGNEGGFLPTPAVIPPTPVGYNYNRRDIVVLNVSSHSLFMAPAERADVIVDFSQYAGKTLILYNDAPAPVPAFDTRLDYYTGDPDQTAQGGAPTTLPGYGPNTRTIMQIKVASVAGPVTSVTVGNPGSGYIQPAVNFVSASGTGATATALGAVDHISVNVPGAAGTYATAPAVLVAAPTTTGGVTATAVATIKSGMLTGITVTNPGSGYTVAPAVTVGGAASIATATLGIKSITLTAGGSGYLTAPDVLINDLVPNAGFNATALANLTPGATPFNLANLQAAFVHGQTLVAALAGKGVFEADQNPIIYPVATYNSAYGMTLPTDPYYRIQDLSKSFIPLGGTAAQTIANNVENKAIQELFELNYGRMNATLGTELPTTNFTNQTTVPLGYTDPITETLTDSMTPLSPPAAGDGTQIWKVTHNGVDSHVIHFHLFNVQVINRVGWDGAVRPPDANELGWKESVRMNPLEDAIVALRPTAPKLPFNVPDSVRAMDVTQPIGATWAAVDPVTGNPITVTNALVNFHWEYVWHCHILGHEENDMMRPIAFVFQSAVPGAPNPLTAVLNGSPTVAPSVTLTWTDPTPASSPTTLGNPANEIGFRIDRAVGTGPFNALYTALANSTTYTDTVIGSGVTYRYRVVAFNVAGQTASTTQSITTPTGGWPIAPTGFKLVSFTSSTGGAVQVNLSWTANATNTTGYTITRTGGTGTFTPVNITSRTTTTYGDPTAVIGTTYTYSLVAVNGSAVSAATTLVVKAIAVPPAPTNLASPSQTQTTVTLTWTNTVSGPGTGVLIYMSLNATTWTALGSTTASTYVVTGLTNHTLRPTPYYFRLYSYVSNPVYLSSNPTPVIGVNTLP
jgi:FtsP/CotA-like multicopper oxidase with cupredoxin domain